MPNARFIYYYDDTEAVLSGSYIVVEKILTNHKTQKQRALQVSSNCALGAELPSTRKRTLAAISVCTHTGKAANHS